MSRSILLFAGMFAACTDDTTTDTGTALDTVDAWAGEAPHLRVVGRVQGDVIDLDVSGADAEDTGTLYCERNYPKGLFEKYEIKYNLEYKGQPAELELTLQGGQDLGSYALADGGPEFGIKIETADGTEYENIGATGSFEVSLVTGTPDGAGIIPDDTGAVGGYIDVTLDDGNTLQGSFTANCAANDLG